jgi:hypothetical protein
MFKIVQELSSMDMMGYEGDQIQIDEILAFKSILPQFKGIDK